MTRYKKEQVELNEIGNFLIEIDYKSGLTDLNLEVELMFKDRSRCTI
jgi:hypothetical protein